jgi:hypothetical protein
VLDRGKIVEALRETLGAGVPEDALDRAADRLNELGEDWEEIALSFDEMGPTYSMQCEDICVLGDWLSRGIPLRVFRKKG